MGNSLPRNRRHVPDLPVYRASKGDFCVYILGDQSLSATMFQSVAIMFGGYSGSGGFAASSASEIVSFGYLYEAKRIHVELVTDIDHFLNEYQTPCVIMWLTDCTYIKKQQTSVAQAFADASCLPSALCDLVASYHAVQNPGEKSLTSVLRTCSKNTYVTFFHVLHYPCNDFEEVERVRKEALEIDGFQLFMPSDQQTLEGIDLGQQDDVLFIWNQVEQKSTRKVLSRCDIGEYGDHLDSPGIDILRHPSLASASFATAAVRAVTKQVAAARGQQPVWDADFELSEAVLDVERCQALVTYADEQACGQVGLDVKLDVSMEQVCGVIGKEAFSRLELMFGRLDEIKLRRAEGNNQDPQCINFHLDYNYRTMQIALNGDTEYDGGRLTYLVDGEVKCPTRPAGSCTIHDDTIVHGVSPLVNGRRYGLFFLLQKCR